jgi:hypothetical protein
VGWVTVEKVPHDKPMQGAVFAERNRRATWGRGDLHVDRSQDQVMRFQTLVALACLKGEGRVTPGGEETLRQVLLFFND